MTRAALPPSPPAEVSPAEALLATRLAAAEETLSAWQAAVKEVRRLEALLKIASDAERAAGGGMGGIAREASDARKGLLAVRAAIEAGSRAVLLAPAWHGGKAWPGALLRVTAARAVVLTERGEWAFTLKDSGTAHGAKPGDGIGDARGCRLDLSALEGA